MRHGWPDSRAFWRGKRIVVTGGEGFLGGAVVAKLRERGDCQIVVPGSERYDLRLLSDVQSLLDDACPHIVIHLAAWVGDIGANRARPADFFYDNLLLGYLHLRSVELPHLSRRLSRVQVDVRLRLICHAANNAAIRWKWKVVRQTVWKGSKPWLSVHDAKQRSLVQEAPSEATPPFDLVLQGGNFGFIVRHEFLQLVGVSKA